MTSHYVERSSIVARMARVLRDLSSRDLADGIFRQLAYFNDPSLTPEDMVAFDAAALENERARREAIRQGVG